MPARRAAWSMVQSNKVSPPHEVLLFSTGLASRRKKRYSLYVTDSVNAISQQLRMGERLIAAARLHLFVRIIEVQAPEDLDRTFATLRSARPDAVLIAADTFFLANAKLYYSM